MSRLGVTWHDTYCSPSKQDCTRKGAFKVGFINVSVCGIHRSMIVEPSSWRPVLCVAFTLMCALERVPGWSGVMTTGVIAKVLLVMLMQHVVSRVLMIKAVCPAIPTVRRFVAHHHCCPRCHRRYWPPLDLALEATMRGSAGSIRQVMVCAVALER